MDYGAIMYYISSKSFKGLDSFFSELDKKIALSERNTIATFSLYQQDHLTSHASLKSTFEHEMKLADSKYNAAYKEINGGDDIKHAYAANESGWGYLTQRNAMDSELLDLRFEEMTNNLFTSSIISLYVLLESELKRLCNYWRKLTHNRIEISDFGQRDYVGASYKYIDKVMGINMSSIDSHLNKLKDLQNLRNRLIHDGGVLLVEQLKSVKKLTDSSNGGLIYTLDGDEYLLKITKIDYATHWHQVIRDFFENIFWSIDLQMEHRFLKARMQYLLGVLNPHIYIKNFTATQKNSKYELSFTVESNDFESLYNFKVRMIIRNSSYQHVKATTEVIDNEQIVRLITILNEEQHLFWDRTFSGFILNGKIREVKIAIQ